MIEAELMEKVRAFLGKTHDELPCWKIVDSLYSVPIEEYEEVSRDFVQVGDVVVFGEDDGSLCPDHSIGVYLGNGKVVTSLRDRGCVIVPWRFARELFIRGVRVGRRV